MKVPVKVLNRLGVDISPGTYLASNGQKVEIIEGTHSAFGQCVGWMETEKRLYRHWYKNGRYLMSSPHPFDLVEKIA